MAKRLQNVKVFVRMHQGTQEANEKQSINVINNHEIEIRLRNEKKYYVDGIFKSENSQKDVYKAVAEPQLQEVLGGYNSTLFMYGQTGSGKSYTLNGSTEAGFSISNNTGMILRFMKDLLEELQLKRAEYTLKVQHFMIYNEEIVDLLSIRPINDPAAKVRIYDQKKDAIVIQGIEDVSVRGFLEVTEVFEKAINRKSDAVNFLKISESKAHTLYIAKLHVKVLNDHGTELMQVGKMTFVDLAGSEFNKSANKKKVGEKHTIYASLLTFGRVVNALNEKTLHVPFRESKLTRILQDSLGGSNVTNMICTMKNGHNPEENALTLDFCSKMRNITNTLEANKALPAETLINQVNDEINELKKEMANVMNSKSIYLDEAKYKEIQEETEAIAQELPGQIQRKRDIEEEIKYKDSQILQLQEFFTADEATLAAIINETEHKNELLKKEKQHLKEKQHELKKHYLKEMSIHNQAAALMKNIDETLGSHNILHEKVSVLRAAARKNEELFEMFSKTINHTVDSFNIKLEKAARKFNKHHANLIMGVNSSLSSLKSETDDLKALLLEVYAKLPKVVASFKTTLTCEEDNLAYFARCCDTVKEMFLQVQSLIHETLADVIQKDEDVNRLLTNQCEILEDDISDILVLIAEHQNTNEKVSCYFKELDEALEKKQENLSFREQKFNDISSRMSSKLSKVKELLKSIEEDNRECTALSESCDIENLEPVIKASMPLWNSVPIMISEITEQEAKLAKRTAVRRENTEKIIGKHLDTHSTEKLCEMLQNIEKEIGSMHERAVGKVNRFTENVESNINKCTDESLNYVEETLCVSKENCTIINESLPIIHEKETNLFNIKNEANLQMLEEIKRLEEISLKLDKEMAEMHQQLNNSRSDCEELFVHVSHAGDTPVKKILAAKINLNTPKRLSTMMEEQ